MTRRLIADIGGTNARFAIAEDGAAGPVEALPSASFPSFDDALAAALGRLGGESIREAAIAAAGPVSEGAIDVTNLPWRIEARAVAAELGGAEVRLLNDLEAVALALPRLGDGERAPLRQTARTERGRALLAVNVGSGFGAAAAVPTVAGWAAVAGEPGHMAYAAATEDEWEQRGAVTSIEDVLSGRGLAALYRRLGGTDADAPAEVFDAGAEDTAAAAATALLARLLGRVAGDLVLATGAWSGVFLCGSVVSRPRGDAFDRTLLEAFDAKGAMAARMARVPVWRITAPNPALLGLASLRF